MTRIWETGYLLRKEFRTAAPIVKVIHHGSRVSTSSHVANSIKKDEIGQVTRPGPAVFGAHLDQSIWQGFNVIHKYFPDDCEALLHGRCMIINVRFLALPYVWISLLMFLIIRHGVQLKLYTNILSGLPTQALCLIQTLLFVPTDGLQKSGSLWALNQIRVSINGTINSLRRPTKFWSSNSSTTLAMPGHARIRPLSILSMRLQSLERALKLGQSLYGLTIVLFS